MTHDANGHIDVARMHDLWSEDHGMPMHQVAGDGVLDEDHLDRVRENWTEAREKPIELHGTPDDPQEVSDGNHRYQVAMEMGEHRLPAYYHHRASLSTTAKVWTHKHLTYGPDGGYVEKESEVHGPLYHGGGKRLREGDEIKPGRKTNPWGDEGTKSSHVYFTTRKDTAAAYAEQSGGHVYEVEPTGDFKGDYSAGDYKTPHPLKVVRKLHPSEWHDDGKTASLTAAAFFRHTAGTDNEGDSDVRGDGQRTAGNGKPRRQPGAGAAPAGAGEDSAGGARAVGDGEGSPRRVTFHPAAEKEMGKIEPQDRKRIAATIDSLAADGPSAQTHALNGQLKGWSATKGTRGHRIVHRNQDDGTLHVGYVGLHDYDTAIRRLTGLTGFFQQAESAGVPLPRGRDNEGHEVELDPQDGWQHKDGSVSHEDGTTVSDHPVKTAGAAIVALAAAETGTGIMVALVPPRAVAEDLAVAGGEPADRLHITLAYLGKTADYSPEQIAWLPELVGAWAARQRPVGVTIGGVLKFGTEPEQEHVFAAPADIPGGAQLHSGLAAYLTGHGYRLPSEHGWLPHLTLAYVDRHFRFMPRVTGHSWVSTEVLVKVGPQRHMILIGGIPR